MRKNPRSPLDSAMLEDGRRNDWLADKIGAYPEQVSRWRAGIHVPADGTREKIADALGREVSDLWPDENERRAA